MEVRKPKPAGRQRLPIELDVQRGVYTAMGYRTVRTSQREGWSYSSGSGDRHLEFDRAALVNQSRDFYRNNAIYRGMIDRAVGYIVGLGFKLQVRGAKRTVDGLEGRWRDFQRRPEVRNLFSGTGVADIVCTELLVCGDVTALKVKRKGGGKQIQLFESEQMADQGVGKTGVTTDRYGAPATFRLCPYDGRTGQVNTAAGQRYEARDVIFVSNSHRSSQTRGEPALQSAFAMLNRINDACDSEAIAYQMISRFVLSLVRKKGPEKAYTESKVDPQGEGDGEGELAARLTELGYAIIFEGEEGDEIKGIERNIPSLNFSETIRMFLRLLGLPMGMPLELILLDWSKANYSQSRAVLEQAFQNFIKIQQKLVDFFYEPLARWIVPELDGKNVQHSWITPTFPWIDQLKEAQAQAEKLDRCLTTHGQALKSQNQDRDDVVAMREEEIRDAIQRARRIEADLGEKVPWQLFAGVNLQTAPAAGQGRAAANDADDADDQDEETDDADNRTRAA